MKIEEEIRQSKKFKTSREKALINIIFSANWIHNKQQEFFKPFGITPQQYNILRILKGQHPNSISGTDIKSRMLDKNSDVSRILDRLALKNLIERRTSQDDRRASDVSISLEGIEVLERVAKAQKETYSFLKLTEDEAETLSQLLDKSRG